MTDAKTYALIVFEDLKACDHALFHGDIQSLQVRLHTIDFALEDPVQALTTHFAP